MTQNITSNAGFAIEVDLFACYLQLFIQWGKQHTINSLDTNNTQTKNENCRNKFGGIHK